MRRVFPLALVILAVFGLAERARSVGDLTCPAIVETAITTTKELCSGTGRNQVCYGNVQIEAQPQPGVESFVFEQQGDIVDALRLQSMALSPLDANFGVWGVGVMRLQANLPDTMPGQNVTFIMFGDVEVINNVSAPSTATVPVTASSALNVRSRPSASGAVVNWLTPGTAATANGRLADTSWLRLAADNAGFFGGWVYAPSVAASGDLSVLEVIDPTNTEPALGPMQSFYLRTGVGGVSCAEAPPDGLLIQTPHGVGRVQLQINGVNVELGSTVFFQAGEHLSVSTIEGSARIEATGAVQWAVPGTTVQVPLDSTGTASGAPTEAQPYNEPVMRALPISLLDRSVPVFPPLDAERIALANADIARRGFACGVAPLDPCPTVQASTPLTNAAASSSSQNNDDDDDDDEGGRSGNGNGRGGRGGRGGDEGSGSGSRRGGGEGSGS